MTNEEAIECLNALSGKLGMHFTFHPDQKLKTWRMRILDALGPDGEDMPPCDNNLCLWNLSLGWYAQDRISDTFGFGLNPVRWRQCSGNIVAAFVSMLSGRTFASSRRSVTVPSFSSYEELMLKLEVLS